MSELPTILVLPLRRQTVSVPAVWQFPILPSPPSHPSIPVKALLLTPFLLACAPLSASAAVYINDAVIVDWDPFGRCFNLTQSPNGFVLVEVNQLTPAYEFEFIGRSISAYYGLFSVTSGEELTYLNASSKLTLGGSNTLTIGNGQSAYIGYWSQRTGEPASPSMDPNDIFGWAKVSVSGGELVVTESASADGGIIVGTTQAIPETSSALLASVGVFALLRRRRVFAANCQ